MNHETISRWANYAIAVAIGGILGLVAGRLTAPELPTKVVDDTRAKQAERIRQLEEENTSLKKHTVETTTVDYSPATAKPVRKTTVRDTHVDRTRDTRIATDTTKVVEVVKRVEVIRDPPKNKLGPMVDLNLTNGRVSFGGLYQRDLGKIPILNLPVSLGVHALVAPPRGAFEKTEIRGGLSLSGGF